MARSSLIIVNYNTANRTRRLVKQTAGAVDEVIVVDNASPQGDGTILATLPELYEHVRFLPMAENRGYGAGANAGASVSSGEVIIVSNPDVIIDPDALRRLIAAVSDPTIGLAAPMFIFPDGTLQASAHRRDLFLLSTIFEYCGPLRGLGVRLSPDWWGPTLFTRSQHMTSRDCRHVLGALMAVRKDAFDAVGGFDEGFFLYREETDLCRRLRQAGWRIRHVADAKAVHEWAMSTPDRTTPTSFRAECMVSHYRYIAKFRGRAFAVLARLVGTACLLAWIVVGPKRSLARGPLRWHLGLRDPDGR